MGNRVNDYLVKWRREDGHIHKNDVVFSGYERDNYLINAKVPRFGSEKPRYHRRIRTRKRYLSYGRCLQLQPDLFSVRTHKPHVPGRSLSESERIIAAIGGKGRRLNVIMPFLYESRQHKRSSVNPWTALSRFRNWYAWAWTISSLSTLMIPVYRMRSL